jgi:hypothetical protein
MNLRSRRIFLAILVVVIAVVVAGLAGSASELSGLIADSLAADGCGHSPLLHLGLKPGPKTRA